MKSKYLIEIRCDGNNQIGFGHIRRCLTLKERLEKDGYLVNLLGISNTSQKLIDNFLPSNYNNYQSNDLIIIDSPDKKVDEFLLEKKPKGIPNIALDYFGDIEVDYNILIYPHHQYRAKKNAYVGYEYVMIRDEILSVKKEKIYQKKEDNFVLVAIGGCDILGQGRLAAKYLSDLGINVVLASGPPTNYMNVEGSPSYRVCKNQTEFIYFFSQCNWIVTNGGGTLFEALYLNKSIFVLPQTKAEETIAIDMYQNELIEGIGLESLNSNLKNRTTNVIFGEKIIDGQGSNRISEIISNIFFKNS